MIGFGRIGQLVAKRAQSFEMEVLGFDKFVSAERFRELGVEGSERLEDLLGRADIVTLHTPKTPETIGLIDADAVAAMKAGARLVNCARGELVDLDALGRASRAAGSPAPRSTSSPPSPSPSTGSSTARTSSSPLTWAPRPPRRRTGQAWSPPSR